MVCAIHPYRRRVQAANKMKTELGLSQDLNASDAVVAGAELLGVTFESPDEKSLTLKERVAVLCREAVSWHCSHRWQRLFAQRRSPLL